MPLNKEIKPDIWKNWAAFELISAPRGGGGGVENKSYTPKQWVM